MVSSLCLCLIFLSLSLSNSVYLSIYLSVTSLSLSFSLSLHNLDRNASFLSSISLSCLCLVLIYNIYAPVSVSFSHIFSFLMSCSFWLSITECLFLFLSREFLLCPSCLCQSLFIIYGAVPVYPLVSLSCLFILY